MRVPYADLLLRDAPIYRDGGWVGDRLAIRDGRIVGVGDHDDVAHLVGPGTEVESLMGRWLLPAFHDSHVHPVQAGTELNLCNLADLDSVPAYLDRITSYAAEHPQRTWITGGGWSMDAFPGGVPTAALLDRVCPDRPIYLPNRDHHSAWVNTRALELAGIEARTPEPRDGRIERGPDGSPTGALHEGAMGLVAVLAPRPTPEELTRGLITAQRHLHSVGIVGWQDALVGTGLGMLDTLDTYIAAHRSGQLTAKTVLALWWDRERGLDQLPELIERRQRAAAAGLRASAVKIMQDGVCETHTAAMLDPYRDADGLPTDNHGLSFIDAGDLATYVAALDAADFQVHVHALGDRAVRDSLDAVEHALRVNGQRGNRHHLAHLQVIDPVDVGRFAALGVTANAQPLWACRDEAVEVLTLPFISEAARTQHYVFGSLLRAGARLACGSDWPVSAPDPLLGMHVAVNRRAPDQGSDVQPLLPHEALTVAEAIGGYTAGTAYLNGLEAVTGRLQTGFAADVVAVDADVLHGHPAMLGEARVTHTFADGRVVHGG